MVGYVESCIIINLTMYRLLNDGFKEGVYAVILADGSYIHSYHIYHAAVLHIFLDMELVNKGR